MRWIWFPLALIGCYRTPYALAPSTEPLSEGWERGSAVSATECTEYLFGVIALTPRPTTADLVEAASGGRPMVQVTWDRSFMWWLVGVTRCDTLSGYTAVAPTSDGTGPEQFVDRIGGTGRWPWHSLPPVGSEAASHEGALALYPVEPFQFLKLDATEAVLGYTDAGLVWFRLGFDDDVSEQVMAMFGSPNERRGLRAIWYGAEVKATLSGGRILTLERIAK